LTELVALDDAIGRITATDTFSKVALPVGRASVFDGVAVRGSDFAKGLPDTSRWKLGVDYVRADTGDDFDDAFDAVVMIEKAAIQPDGSVIFDDDVEVSPGSNVNQRGATIKVGDPLLKERVRIRPTDLAALAVGGHTMVEVLKRPKVAFIPTGSELVAAGMKPCRGQNIDANSLMVKHMLIEMGAEPVIFPIVRDDKESLQEAFHSALAHCDIVVMNAGSAVGEEDFNVALIKERGEVFHHFIAAVPGRPTMLAVADEKPVIIVPGPTMSAYFSTEWCLRSTVAQWLGVKKDENPRVKAYLTNSIKTHGSLAYLSRINLERGDDGQFRATAYNFKGGQLAQALAANAQRVSPIGEINIEAGELIEVELLRNRID